MLFVAMVYVPLYLQTVRGYSAFLAGLSLIPMFLGLIVATSIAGPAIAKSGRYKFYPVIAAIITGIAMWFLGYVGAGTSVWVVMIPLVFVGAGAGLFVQVALLGGQNAAPHEHLGAATGALNFFKTMGGAFGTAIFSAVLAAATAGARTQAQLASAYGDLFKLTVPLMAVSLILALVMREKPLSTEMIDVAEGKVEVPEF
ncbi:MFS transporter [Gryllotalpicola reticulitermitis]|uniref:MFS transporter n=1 Tax=Gryllotalpicola reticulitermitis TaxID=1184153 RepID=A0ABV8Q8G2_9MICO